MLKCKWQKRGKTAIFDAIFIQNHSDWNESNLNHFFTWSNFIDSEVHNVFQLKCSIECTFRS